MTQQGSNMARATGTLRDLACGDGLDPELGLPTSCVIIEKMA
jgi:hypothetical protein